MIDTTDSGQISLMIKSYYEKVATMEVSHRILKKIRKIADKVAQEIVDSYDFKQEITKLATKDGGEKVIITSIFTKKKQ